MTKLYSYIIKFDAGSAPNPFWGFCSLAICKPAIRRTASVGDWIIATGSKNAKCNDLSIHDLSGCLVYAMKISTVLTMEEYDAYCKVHLQKKIPNWKTKDWRQKVGDSIYDFSYDGLPGVRLSVLNTTNQNHDLGGLNVLLSNRYFYFGEQAISLPSKFNGLVKSTQGHLVCKDLSLIQGFEHWISQFRTNKIYGDPQRRWAFDRNMTKANKNKCSQ